MFSLVSFSRIFAWFYLKNVKRITFYKKEKLSEDMKMFVPMIERLLDENSTLWGKEADKILRVEIENTCTNILENTAVFKNDEQGQESLLKFLGGLRIE